MPVSGVIEASMNNSQWYMITNFSNDHTATSETWTINIPESRQGFWNYYRLGSLLPETTNYMAIGEIELTATYMYTPSDNSIPVKGNGLTLGITEGDHECAINSAYASNQRFTNIVAGSIYGTAYGTSTTGLGNSTVGKTIGVTTSAQYSGLIVDTTYLGSFSPTFAIKY